MTGHTLRFPGEKHKGSSALTPSFKVLDDWPNSTADDDPDDLFVTIVDFLVLSKCRNQGKVTWVQVLTFAAALADDCTVALDSVDDGVQLAVVVDS